MTALLVSISHDYDEGEELFELFSDSSNGLETALRWIEEKLSSFLGCFNSFQRNLISKILEDDDYVSVQSVVQERPYNSMFWIERKEIWGS